MKQKLTIISGLVTVLVFGILTLSQPVQGLILDTSDESQKVMDTIYRSIKINLEAAYTLDSSEFATIYINDPRGGEIPAEALADIQESRQDPTIQKDQAGYLDYMQAVIERRKKVYDNFVASLRAKQEVGTITAEEQAILDGEINGWPTRTPEIANLTTTPTQPCAIVRNVKSASPVAYPAPNPSSQSTVVPDAEQTVHPCGPTAVPTSFVVELRAEGRGPNPEILPQESFEIDILSVKIEGDVARAIVYKSGVTSEEVLVKVNGQWFIAGGKLLKYEP